MAVLFGPTGVYSAINTKEAARPRGGVEVMLVLSRKSGERILIGDNVTVTVVRIGPNNVRLGIEAPRELNIVREELCIDFESCERTVGNSAGEARSEG
jgi:carbon storage regulator